MNMPNEISIEEWNDIMKVPEVQEAYGIKYGDSPEKFTTKVYGAKYAFDSGRRSYRGELFVIYSEMLGKGKGKRTFCLVRHGRGFEVIA